MDIKTKYFKVDYDYKNNILFLYDYESKSYISVEIKKDFVIDFDKNDNITAIEIFNFSKGVEEIKEKLEKVLKNKNVKVEFKKIKPEDDTIIISIFLDLKGIKENTILLIEEKIKENALLAKV